MTKKYTITNLGESNACITKELTQEQYMFLNEIFTELNEKGPAYAPYIYICEHEE